VPLSHETLQVLDDLGFIHRKTNTLARDRMANDVLKPQMIANHKIERYTDDAVERYGASVDRLTRYLFHDEDEYETLDNAVMAELQGLVTSLCSTSVQSALQKSLTNGSPAYVLGAGRVTKLFKSIDESGNELRRNVSVTLRYVSKQPEVIKRLMLDPMLDRKENQAKRERGWLAMIEQRQPKLRRYISGDLLVALQSRYEHGLGLELGTGNEEPADDED